MPEKRIRFRHLIGEPIAQDFQHVEFSDSAGWITRSGAGHFDLSSPWEMTSTPQGSVNYSGPLAVLVDARSTSAADFTVAFLKQTGRAHTFGSTSHGAFGSAVPLTKFDHWAGIINPIRCFGLDGAPLEGHPPQVDVAVAMTPEDLAEKKDTVLNAALEWIHRNPQITQ